MEETLGIWIAALLTLGIFSFLYKDNPVNIGGISGFGKPGVTKDNIMQVEKPEDLVRIQRLLFYDSKIITLEVYVW